MSIRTGYAISQEKEPISRRSLRCHPSSSNRVGGSMSARFTTEFVADVSDMDLHRAGTETEIICNLFVPPPNGQLEQHLHFSRRQSLRQTALHKRTRAFSLSLQTRAGTQCLDRLQTSRNIQALIHTPCPT